MNTETVKTIIVIVVFVLATIGPALYATRKRKCLKCGTRCKRTGVAGTVYAQYYCPTCDRYFFLEHFKNKEG